EPASAPAEVLQQLEAMLHGGGAEAAPVEVVAEPEPVVTETVSHSAEDGDDDITDDEFEALLDQLDDSSEGDDLSSSAGFVTDVLLGGDPNDDITDDEFDLLLDALDGEDSPGDVPQAVASATPSPVEDQVEQVVSQQAPSVDTAVTATKKAAVKQESPVVPSKKGGHASKVESSVRVDTRRLDDVMNMVGELVLIRNRFDNLKQSISSEIVDRTISDLNLLTTDIQEVVMRLRMQPVRKVFSRFPRVVRDLAKKLGRKVKLQLVGEETEVDKNLVEELADPLIHLIRNAVDHGIETPDVRLAHGKPAEGTVVLSAEQEGDHILLTIKDDGAGMNPETLRHLAVKRGMMDHETAMQLSNRALFSLIFEPGFSTKKEISDVSGRGVGMDVVKTHISQLNGQVEIDSEVGGGTTISIQVPLTLAIMPTLMVLVGNQNYAIPLPGIMELFERSLVEVGKVGGREVVRLRDRTYPLIYASQLLDEPRIQSADQRVLVIELTGHSLALVVDQVIGQEEVVIKPLGSLLRGMPGYSGATITGDGSVAMILDIAGMISKKMGNEFLAYGDLGEAKGEGMAA
ncbi:MAG TPA: chemotaxis protein CheA, partial [Gammaproteobacteria bacterium]|nr:chemotaxis protein CheA [Gammaproteobacteria bacterium]